MVRHPAMKSQMRADEHASRYRWDNRASVSVSWRGAKRQGAAPSDIAMATDPAVLRSCLDGRACRSILGVIARVVRRRRCVYHRRGRRIVRLLLRGDDAADDRGGAETEHGCCCGPAIVMVVPLPDAR